MNLLFVLENYLPHHGGVEVVFKNLCEGLAGAGHSVTVLTRQLPGTAREERRGGVTILRVPSADSRYVFTFAAVPRAMRLARRADVVHTTTFNAAPAAWLAAKAARKPVVITIHETWLGKWREYTDFPPWKADVHEALERAVFSLDYTRYVCVSHATERRLTEVLPRRRNRVVTIHNGFDPTPWRTPRPREATQKRADLGLDGRFVVFAWGRPGASKGFGTLLEAFPLVKQRIPDAALVLALSGGAQYARVADAFVRTAPDGVHVLRDLAYDELQVCAHLADCLVVPSYCEGFGYAVLEAVSTGKPLVTTDTTSIPEVVHGKHVLVEPRSPAALARGIVAVSQGSWVTAPEKVFPWPANIEAHERLYASLVRGGAGVISRAAAGSRRGRRPPPRAGAT
jgi:glycosyltransferase involved in cell wall biosynthesis